MATRNIEVEVDVYAAIWADRQPGENSEEEILRRKFGVPDNIPKNEKRVAWVDPRQGVSLYDGEEIFRVYKGKEYRAKAHNGFLVRTDNGTKYNRLNQLSRNIGAATENAWMGWYIERDGKKVLLNELRNSP